MTDDEALRYLLENDVISVVCARIIYAVAGTMFAGFLAMDTWRLFCPKISFADELFIFARKKK